MTAILMILLLLLTGTTTSVTPMPPPAGVPVGTVRHTFDEWDTGVYMDNVPTGSTLLAAPEDYLTWIETLPEELGDLVADEVDATFDDHFLVATAMWRCAGTATLLYEAASSQLIVQYPPEGNWDSCDSSLGIDIFTVSIDEVDVDPATLTIR